MKGRAPNIDFGAFWGPLFGFVSWICFCDFHIIPCTCWSIDFVWPSLPMGSIAWRLILTELVKYVFTPRMKLTHEHVKHSTSYQQKGVSQAGGLWIIMSGVHIPSFHVLHLSSPEDKGEPSLRCTIPVKPPAWRQLTSWRAVYFTPKSTTTVFAIFWN